jgi:N-acetylglucosaminyldiphosphoundecaprenol N-acetyl-beta-D-mannosaminyltransferase
MADPPRTTEDPREAEIRQAYADATLVVADGMPLIWASRIQGTPLPERVAGSDLIWSLSRASAPRGRGIFLVGGEVGVADRAADVLQHRIDGLHVVGTAAPQLSGSSSDRELLTLRRRLGEAQPDVVFLGLPLQKQVAVARECRASMPQAWFVGVGISFSFVSGDVPRAPSWMRRSGFEWSWRLVQEPNRLLRRYVVDGVPFAPRLFIDAARKRMSARLCV